mgnify:CR=1 FL=1
MSLSEAEVKRAVADRLEIGQAQGHWLYHRLNAGDFIIVEGERRRRVKGQGKGCADFVVIQPWVMKFQKRTIISPDYHTTRVTYLELKTAKGRQSLDQVDFEVMVKRMNCRYFIIRDADNLEEILK